MKYLILITFLLSMVYSVLGQEKLMTVNEVIEDDSLKLEDIDPRKLNTGDIEFERPFNFFTSAGVGYRPGDHYNVAVSPVDHSVQFEEVSPVVTRISLGMVWNPLPNLDSLNVTKYIKNKRTTDVYEASRQHLAIALLINVFELGFTADDINTSSPIDVGFGLGFRNDNFLILGTVEFTPTNTPRTYFIDQFKDQNEQLILANTEEPVQTISPTDDALFHKKIFTSIGLKIAYAFSKKKEN